MNQTRKEIEPAPEFTKTLENLTVKEAETVILECQLSKPHQKTQWMKNNEPVVNDGPIAVIVDTHRHQLIIRDVTLENAGNFSCHFGFAGTECQLQVEEIALEFTKKLQDQTVTETVTVTLECQLSKPYREVKWEMNSNPILPYDRITVTAEKFIHQLVIRNATPDDSGEYRCICANVRTHCTLTVEEHADFTKSLKHQTVIEKENVILECQLSKPMRSHKAVQWMRNNEPVVQDDRIIVTVDVHKHQLIINDVTLQDTGIFACVYGNVGTNCTLQVEEFANAFTRTLKNQTVHEKVTIALECRLSKPNMTVEWVKDDDQICLDDRISATVAIYTHRLIVKDVTMEDAGTFQCIYGNVSTYCLLTVEELTERKDWFDSDRYSNWVKISVSLCYVKEGITEFSNNKAVAFHKDIKEKVLLKRSQAATTTCKKCTHKQARKTKDKDKNTTTWRMDCNMNICSVWLKEILPYHRHLEICPNIEWKNSDPRLWSSDSWEIVKLFQPFGCQDHHSAEECDATGLLTLILDCRFFSKFMSNLQIIQKIKDVRNVCMHSKDLVMNDEDTEKSLDLLVTFLGEPELQKYQSAVVSAKKIQLYKVLPNQTAPMTYVLSLRDSRLGLALKKSLVKRVLQETLTEVKHNIARLEDTETNLHGETGGMSAQQDTYLGDYQKRLREFQDMFSEVENTLRDIIEEKDHNIRDVFKHLLNRLKDLEQDNREVDEYYQPKMSPLDSEQQDVKLKSQVPSEQPAERQSSDAESTPYFSKGLGNQTVYEKSTVTLECQLSVPNKTVRWLKGANQVCSNDRITVEINQCLHRLIIRDVALGDAGTFWCFCDNVSSYCTVKVIELAPEFTRMLENHTVMETVPITLGCQLSKPNKQVRWFKGDQQVTPDDRITIITDEYTHQLTINDLKVEDAGTFRCVCNNASTYCTLTVNEVALEVTRKLKNNTVKETGSVTLKCQLSKPNMKVNWMKDEQQVIPDDRIIVAVDRYKHKLVINDLTLEDVGVYMCTCGNISTDCTLNVEELPVKFVKLLVNEKGYIGSSFSTTLSCELDRPYRRVTWTKDGQVVNDRDGLKIVAGLCTHQLVFSELTWVEAGKYKCAYGDLSTSAKLTVKIDDDRGSRELMLNGDYGQSAMDVCRAVQRKRLLLQTLVLMYVNLSSLDSLTSITTLQKLKQFELMNITLSHEQCHNLGQNLRSSPQLRDLRLQRISCTTHGNESGCVDLELNVSLRLHGLRLKKLPFTRVVFNAELLLRCDINLLNNAAGQMSTLQNLLVSRNLQQLNCRKMSDAAAVSKLVNTLSKLHSLHRLSLGKIDFGSVIDIRLSPKLAQLESVEMYKCKFDQAGLVRLLHQHSLSQRRVEIDLWHVIITGKEDVISKIRQSPDTEVTKDVNVKFSKGEWSVGWFTFYTRK